MSLFIRKATLIANSKHMPYFGIELHGIKLNNVLLLLLLFSPLTICLTHSLAAFKSHL